MRLINCYFLPAPNTWRTRGHRHYNHPKATPNLLLMPNLTPSHPIPHSVSQSSLSERLVWRCANLPLQQLLGGNTVTYAKRVKAEISLKKDIWAQSWHCPGAVSWIPTATVYVRSPPPYLSARLPSWLLHTDFSLFCSQPFAVKWRGNVEKKRKKKEKKLKNYWFFSCRRSLFYIFLSASYLCLKDSVAKLHFSPAVKEDST